LIGDRPLFGPPPAELFDPVPAADLREAVLAGIPGLMADLEPDTRNVLLTLARIWHTTATGAITSKDAAASWAAERLDEPERNVILTAREQYLSGTHGDWREAMASAKLAAEAMRRAVA
jgi:Aminoglycoside adenylyltransferase, C-terminal domain